MPPGTLVSYLIRIALLIDLRAGDDPAHWPELWEEFHCADDPLQVYDPTGALPKNQEWR